MLINLMEVGGSFHNISIYIYAYQIITYILNILNFICQLYLSKAGKKSPAWYNAFDFEIWILSLELWF